MNAGISSSLLACLLMMSACSGRKDVVEQAASGGTPGSGGEGSTGGTGGVPSTGGIPLNDDPNIVDPNGVKCLDGTEVAGRLDGGVFCSISCSSTFEVPIAAKGRYKLVQLADGVCAGGVGGAGGLGGGAGASNLSAADYLELSAKKLLTGAGHLEDTLIVIDEAPASVDLYPSTDEAWAIQLGVEKYEGFVALVDVDTSAIVNVYAFRGMFSHTAI